MISRKTWRAWLDDDGIVHVVEFVPDGMLVLFCKQEKLRFTARHALGLETLLHVDERPITCLTCAAWQP